MVRLLYLIWNELTGENKVVYTATPVAGGGEGAVMSLAGAVLVGRGHKRPLLKVKFNRPTYGPTDRWTNGPRDRHSGLEIALPATKTSSDIIRVRIEGKTEDGDIPIKSSRMICPYEAMSQPCHCTVIAHCHAIDIKGRMSITV